MSRLENTKLKKKQIIEAAMTVLFERGFCDMKIKDVAQKAGVSAGLICHHFDTKKGLLLASMSYAVSLYGQRLQQLAEQKSPPRTAVLSIVEMALDSSQFGKELSATWLALYYLSACDDEYEACLESYKQQSYEAILTLTSQIGDPGNAERYARTITSLIDGFWLQNSAGKRGEDQDSCAIAQVQALAIVDMILTSAETNSSV